MREEGQQVGCEGGGSAGWGVREEGQQVGV